MIKEIQQTLLEYGNVKYFTLNDLSLLTAYDINYPSIRYLRYDPYDDYELYIFHTNVSTWSYWTNTVPSYPDPNPLYIEYLRFSEQLISGNDFNPSYNDDRIDSTQYEAKLGNGHGISNSLWSDNRNPIYLANFNTRNLSTTHVCTSYECGNIILPGKTDMSPYDHLDLWFLILVEFEYFNEDESEYEKHCNLISFNYKYRYGKNSSNYDVNKLSCNGCFINPDGTLLNDDISGSYCLFWAGQDLVSGYKPTNLLSSRKTGDITYKGKSFNRPWYGTINFNMTVPGVGNYLTFSIPLLGGTPNSQIRDEIEY